jgi:hypothetical protein
VRWVNHKCKVNSDVFVRVFWRSDERFSSDLGSAWLCNDAGKTRDPNLVWSHSEAYGSAWENRNLRSIDT